MIIEALITTINPIVPAFSLKATKETKLPLCVVGERHTPQYTKEGIIGYEGSGILSVISRSPETTYTLTNQVVEALNNLTGKTVNDTYFKMFRSGEINVDYDDGDDVFYSELQFSFITKTI